MRAMAEPASIFEPEDDDAEELALQEAEADIVAGRVISHEVMKRWLQSWGTSDDLAPPECGE